MPSLHNFPLLEDDVTDDVGVEEGVEDATALSSDAVAFPGPQRFGTLPFDHPAQKGDCPLFPPLLISHRL